MILGCAAARRQRTQGWCSWRGETRRARSPTRTPTPEGGDGVRRASSSYAYAYMGAALAAAEAGRDAKGPLQYNSYNFFPHR